MKIIKVSENNSKLVSTVNSWGSQNPINHKEIIIDNVGVELSEFGDNTYIRHIRSFDKGSGNASRVLKRILDLSDDLGVTLMLNAKATDEGFSTKEIIQWYIRNGFMHEGNGRMIRHPKVTLYLGDNLKEIPIEEDAEKHNPMDTPKL